MRKTTRLSAVVLAIATGLVPASAAAAAPDPATISPPRINWEPCEEEPTAECGTLKVPVDWARPRGQTFDLALARRKATDPANRIGSLVINPGGPGGSGVEFAMFGGDYFTEEIRARFDIVGFDPRGVARSNPVMCSTELLLAGPNPIPTNQAEFDALSAHNRKLAADCRARTGPVFDHVDTLSVVRDIDAIRSAVGDRKLSFYGVSYGTLMGQQYAEVFPHRVRSLALDSNMDHSLGTRGFMDTEAATAQDSFNEFVAGCGRDAGCALHGRDIRAFWANLLARAERGELADPFFPEYKMTPLDLIGLAFGSFYGPDWHMLAQILVAIDTGVPPGDPAVRALSAKTIRDKALRAKSVISVKAFEEEPPPDPDPLPEALHNPFPAVFCSDWSLPVRDHREFAGHLNRMNRIAPDMRFSPLGVTATTACLGWPSRPNNPQHRLRVSPLSPKLLLINALHDPATGYQWAVNAASQLGRQGTLVTYEGWGHGVYRRTDCATSVVDRYLVDGTVPARGTRCAAAPPAAPPGTQRQLQAPRIPTAPSGPLPNVPGWS